MPTIPPQLDAYVKPALPGSLTLITSVLDATSNWLLLRFLYGALHGVKQAPRNNGQGLPGGSGTEVSEKSNVVFLSFMRSFDFWRNEGKRMGLDLASLIAQKRLAYIDGLSHLFSPNSPHDAGSVKSHHIGSLTYSTLSALQDSINLQINDLVKASATAVDQDMNTVLVIDAPDVLLAAAPHNSSPGTKPASESITAPEMIRLCLSLRSIPSIRSMVVSLNADTPLMNHSTSPTPLEIQHKTFLVTLAHQARTILQLRPLGTGRAKDVSGVIRASKGGSWWSSNGEDLGEEQIQSSAAAKDVDSEGEWLYHIAGNGEARVWGRGEAAIA